MRPSVFCLPTHHFNQGCSLIFPDWLGEAWCFRSLAEEEALLQMKG